MAYGNSAEGGVPKPLRLNARDINRSVSVAKLPKSKGFLPVSMEVVEGSSLRGDIPPRVCLLGKDKTTYRVYAIPRDWEPSLIASLEEDVVMEE